MRTTNCINVNKIMVLRFIFAFFFYFSFFSISQSSVMNMEIFVKDFSGIALPSILKFGTNIRYDKVYCVLKIQPHIAYQSLYFNFSYFPIKVVWPVMATAGGM